MKGAIILHDIILSQYIIDYCTNTTVLYSIALLPKCRQAKQVFLLLSCRVLVRNRGLHMPWLSSKNVATRMSVLKWAATLPIASHPTLHSVAVERGIVPGPHIAIWMFLACFLTQARRFCGAMLATMDPHFSWPKD